MQLKIDDMHLKMEKMKNIDNELMDLDKKVEDAKRKQQVLIEQRASLQDKPPTWSDTDEQTCGVDVRADVRVQVTRVDFGTERFWRAVFFFQRRLAEVRSYLIAILNRLCALCSILK